MHFEQQYYKCNQGIIRYYKIGSGNPILFLHGGGARALTYKNILSILSDQYSVIAPDLPYFGASSCPNSPSEFFDLLKKFISSLGQERIIVIGHSLGGAIVLALARDNPNISTIVIVNSAGIAVKYSTPTFIFKLMIEKSYRELIRYRDPSTLSSMAADFFENVHQKLGERSKIISLLKELLLKDIDGLDRIKSKTLILWGKQDEIFPSIDAENLHQKIMNSDLILVDGNHDWCLFDPRTFSDIVINWLKANNY